MKLPDPVCVGRAIVRRRLLLVVGAAVGAATALTLSIAQTPVYVATAYVAVEVGSGQESTGLDRRAEAGILESESVRRVVRQDLQLRQLPPAAEFGPARGDGAVSIQVRDPDPMVAQLVADAYARAYVQELRAQIARGGGAEASISALAEFPSSPVEPNPLRSAALAAVAGLMLAGGVALVVHRFDDTIRSVEDLHRASGLPVLAELPAGPDERPISHDPERVWSVHLRRLGDRLLEGRSPDRARIIGLAGAHVGDGTTRLVAELGMALAMAGERVILVDADLYRPRLHQLFAAASSPGLVELLAGEAIGLSVQPLEIEGAILDLVPAGRSPIHVDDLDESRIGDMLRTMADDYHVMLVDSTPASSTPGIRSITEDCDVVVVVVGAGSTSAKTLKHVVERMERAGVRAIGTVLNRSTSSRSGQV